MSVFTEETNTQGEGEANDQGNHNWLEKVVAAKGEKFQDPQELAKGYLHSQEYIANLERQNKELMEDVGKKDYMQEVLDRIDAQKAKPAAGEKASNENSGTNDTGNQPGVSVEQIKGLIAETLTEQEARNTAAANLQETDRLLEEAFGTDAKQKMQERANELGMSGERMKELASESPTAFMALMGDAPRKETNQTRTSQLNTQRDGFSSQTGEKNFAYYQKMRRENPKLYYSPKVQNEMFTQRTKLGEEGFYNR
jgi:hypothetical protein